VAERCGRSEVGGKPAGVVGAITPGTSRFHQIVAKMARPRAGCTFVLKPSEVAPLNALVLFDALKAVGLPPGVANLVLGTGPVVGRPSPAIPASTSCPSPVPSGRDRVAEVAART